MSMIEGIGDEVTVCFGILSLLLVTLLAWISTNVQDPIIRIIILDRASLRRLLQRIQSIGHNALRAEVTNGSSTPGQTENRDNPGANIQTHIVVTDTETIVPEDDAFIGQEGTATESGPSPDVTAVPSETTPTTDTSQENLNNLTENGSGQRDNLAYQAALLRHQAVNAKVAPEPVTENYSSSDATERSESRVNALPKSPVEPGQRVSEEGTENNLARQQQPTSVVEGSTAQISESSLENTGSENDSTRADSLSAGANGLGSESGTEPDANGDIPEGSIRIRIKYLDERQKVVHAMPDDTIGQFKSHHFASEISENFAVRFIYNGQELRGDGSTLQSYNIQDDSVIHCLLSQVHQTQHQQQATQGPNIDLGFLMFPLFGLILALIWYCRFTYRSYFNAMSTFSLIGITFLFLVATLASFRNHHDVHEHHE